MKRKKIVFTYKTRVKIEIQGYLNVLTIKLVRAVARTRLDHQEGS
mgnify:FL=1